MVNYLPAQFFPVSHGRAGVTVEHVCDGELPELLAVRDHIHQVVLNLALNARDATDGRGQIDIELEPYVLPAAEAEVSRLAPGNYVKIVFRDDGCGMSPDLAEKIFEPFFTSKTGRGSGLGLSMVYGFVEQSNGAIYVDSTEGCGSEFTILLPSLEIAPEDYVGHVYFSFEP